MGWLSQRSKWIAVLAVGAWLASWPAPAHAGASGEPALGLEHATARYRPTGGRLVHHGVRVTDVDQGQLGDCYLLAAVGALAQQRPGDIRRLIRPTRAGDVRVRGFVAGSGTRRGRLVPASVRISTLLPILDGKILYAHGHNTRHVELWPGLLEKGLAMLAGSGRYEGLVTDGYPYQAFELLTGRPAHHLLLAPEHGERLFSLIRRASRQRRPMATSTHREETLLERGIVPFDSGLAPNHSYTVLGVREAHGRKLVVLRNPWGAGEPALPPLGGGMARGDGIFAIPIEDFARAFHSLDVAN